MLISEAAANLQRKNLGARMVKDGLDLWKRQQEQAKITKFKEQKEMREMLERYWPFEKMNEAKPRGLRNLRLEGLFPNKDYQNAKRFVGTLDLGRPGGGAPLITNTGKRMTRTREDPLLRFQFGSNDLRRCVDNTLRYKTDRQSQAEYRKDLDKLVEEKKKNAEAAKLKEREFDKKQLHKFPPWGKRGPGGFPWRKPNEIGSNFFQSLGWSDEKTLKDINSNESSRIGHKPRKLQPIFYPCKNVPATYKNNRRLTPLPNKGKDNGIELVPLLAKHRRFPLKLHLDSTDVTNDKKIFYSSIWNRQGSSYLKELTQQMYQKSEKLKEMKVEDLENVRRHFSTVDAFWGRPGHGAPISALKKRRLDRLLYPQMVPIGVH